MKQPVTIIGRSELLDFPELGIEAVPARIDTGAKTAAIWATNVHEKDGVLYYTLFDKTSDHHSGVQLTTRTYSTRMIASSNGMCEERYVVKLLIQLAGQKIRASFTLADRSAQVYPVLVGRNVLRGKFLVDVQQGQPLTKSEKLRSEELQNRLGSRKGQS